MFNLERMFHLAASCAAGTIPGLALRSSGRCVLHARLRDQHGGAARRGCEHQRGRAAASACGGRETPPRNGASCAEHLRCAAPAPVPTGVAAVYLTDHAGSGPAQVAAAIVGGATPNKITSSALLPGTPNRLLFSAIGLTGGGQVQAASGP